MTEPMTSFRTVNLDGPPLDDRQPLWSAKLELGGSKSDPLYRNYSIRLLIQRAAPIDAYYQPNTLDRKVVFHEPLALMAAVTTRELHGTGPRATLLGKGFRPRAVLLSADSPLYEDVRVTPVGEWPPRLRPEADETGLERRRWVRDGARYEVSAPDLRVTEGRVRVAYVPGDGLNTLLTIGTAIGAPGRRTIFGALEMDLVALEGGGEGLVFDLTPEGLELEARIPSPFTVGAVPTWMQVRLRLERVPGLTALQLRLVLIGGRDAAALAAALAAYAAQVSEGDSPLSIRFRGDLVPPLAWPLTPNANGYACGAPGDVPAVEVSEDATTAWISSVPDPTGGAPTVAKIQRPKFSVDARKPTAQPVGHIAGLEPPGVRPTGPALTARWDSRKRAPDKLVLAADKGWAQTGDMAAELTAAWRGTGALAPDQRLPYAFIALQRGWLQAPLSSKDPVPPSTAGQASALEGVLRFDLAPAAAALSAALDRLATPGLDVVAIRSLAATITLSGSAFQLDLTLEGANGALDGLLWHGRGSPTPQDVLPSLLAGPAALGSLPIGFGGNAPVTGWQVEWPKVELAGPATLTLTLDKSCPLGAPMLTWRPHAELALVAAMGMTRTAESATRPSATRELFPAEVKPTGTDRKVTLKFSGGAPLPTSLAATTQVTGDGAWSWPWPASSAPKPLSASPLEMASVSMVSLTLAGVEFTPAPAATYPTELLLASARYDLPLLDELHANARPPKPAAAPKDSAPASSAALVRPERPPTALDPGALSADWAEKARRRARASTEAHRVVWTQASAGADVVGWHPFDKEIKTGVVPGLIETWRWAPELFHVKAAATAGGLKLGAYALGRPTDWLDGDDALGGLSGTFILNPATSVLELEDQAHPPPETTPRVRVEGFAAASFDTASGKLHDGRGLALAKEARALGAATLRSFDNRALAQQPFGDLLTLNDAAKLEIGGDSVWFWCRDLPVLAAGGGFAFDDRGGLEHAVGPDPASMRPSRLAHTLYEWRLHPSEADGKPAEFELPLIAPLTLRPLRLISATFSGSGQLSGLTVLGSVQVAATVDALQGGPFAEDRAYASGNLVTVAFDAQGRLSAIRRVAYDEATGRLDPVAGGAGPVELVRRAKVRGSDAEATARRVTVTLSLALTVAQGAPKLSSAKLRARLFGQACELNCATPGPDATDLLFTGLAPSAVLRVDTVRLSWAGGAAPELDLDAGVLRAAAEQNVSAFLRPFGGDQLFWLGVEASVSRQTIDHDTGALVITIEDGEVAPGARLFRGFALPAGRLQGLVAVTFKPGAAGQWPTAACVLAEFAFRATAPDAARRVTRLQHRYQAPGRDGAAAPDHELLLDAQFGPQSLSAIRWPAGRVALDMSPFASRPEDAASWSRVMTLDAAGPDLVHIVRPRLHSHSFPLKSLKSDQAPVDHVDANTIRLVTPWRFRAVTDHLLRPADNQSWTGQAFAGVAAGAMAWTSIDETCLWDMRELAAETAHAFVARYRDDQDPQDIPLAGVVRRALAEVGLPTHALLQALAADPPKAPGQPGQEAALALSGGAVIDVVTDEKASRGLTLTPQWLTPWGADDEQALATALGPLRDIPQYRAGLTLRIAAYDAAAGAPRLLKGPPAIAFAARNGDASVLEARLTNLLGRAPEARMIADQSVTERDPPDTLQEPLFVRTLVALAALLKMPRMREPKVLPLSTTCVLANGWDKDRWEALPEARLAVSAWPSDVDVAAETSDPAIDLLVLDGEAVLARRLPTALAATLVDPAGPGILATGRARADASLRALGLSAAPRIVLLARVDPEHADLSAPPLGAPHVGWVEAPVRREALAERVTATPAPEKDTLFASPALGWPTKRGLANAALAHARIGSETARRNAALAWAGRARSLAWPAKGLPSPVPLPSAAAVPVPATEPQAPDTANLRTAVFVSMGQRTAFRRRGAEDFRTPPDRLSVLAPPRVRAPTMAALQQAFKALSGDAGIPRLAPISPGNLEVTVTGQRPGALFTQHEGLIFVDEPAAFDDAQPRFGRPGTRGPVIARQLRAPRSGPLSLDESDLERRRATFVATDETAGARLKPLKAVAGPAQMLRVYGRKDDKETICAVTLAVDTPADGWLTSAWDGRVRLKAKASSETIIDRMGTLGLLPATAGGATPTAELRVGSAVVVFDRMVWGKAIGAAGNPTPADGDALILEVSLSEAQRQSGVERVRTALDAATADTLVQLTLRGREPGAASSAAGDVTLALPAEGLLAGPPKVLTFDLSHIPSRRRWLPRRICSLMFADPAYDRELGSPARTASTTLNEDTYLLGADRAEYDVSATIHFAIWPKLVEGEATPPPGAWQMILAVNSARGGQRRLRLATPTAPVQPPLSLPPGDYQIDGGQAYAIAVAALREADGRTPVEFRAGDRLVLSAVRADAPEKALSLDLGIVDAPVLPPPSAIYGLAEVRGGQSIGAPLLATAPLPTLVEIPWLLEDLQAGHVRRRALFVWAHAPAEMPAVDAPTLSIVKNDRTGGGQVPNGVDDFRPVERL